MAYLLIDPPVSPLSSPSKIQAWLEVLAARAADPRYSDPTVQKQIRRAIYEAREWLAESLAATPFGPTPADQRE